MHEGKEKTFTSKGKIIYYKIKYFSSRSTYFTHLLI